MGRGFGRVTVFQIQTMHTFFKRSPLACACALCSAMAQPTPNEIIITGNPLGQDKTTVPASALGRSDLLERGQSSLGETLNGLPGVSSTYFGPNASRPIIRGLDGDRIRVLNNSAASADVSALSFDHAVPLDVLSTERIEVLRGPAALQYGGSAVGGVVNVIDNRIPREPLSGLSGKAQVQAGTGNGERSVAGLLESGNARWALHADGFDRRTGDVRVPVQLACDKTGETRYARRICNSASQSQGGAVGGSTFWDHGYLGASVNTYQSDYGTVAEDQVTIGMKTTRYALEGQVRHLPGLWDSLKARVSHTDYRHTEFDNGSPGTVFANQAQDLRVTVRCSGGRACWARSSSRGAFLRWATRPLRRSAAPAARRSLCTRRCPPPGASSMRVRVGSRCGWRLWATLR